MNSGVLQGLVRGETNFSQPSPIIVTNAQFLSYVEGDPYFEYVSLLLSENSITSKDVHFVPFSAAVGQKINPNGLLSTYSLVHTKSNAYGGGVLDRNGEIHFIPRDASVGQKISTDGVVSTYNLVYTGIGAYNGGAIDINGDIHFAPFTAPVGQKVSVSGTVSTYSLIVPGTATGAYSGAVLSPAGELIFGPFNATVGQKITVTGTVATYNIITGTNNAYVAGVIAPNGDVVLVPRSGIVGQKIDINGLVSTFGLVYTTASAYFGGVLALNGDIHFAPSNAAVGQKLGSDQVVSTYSLVYTTSVANSSFGVLDQYGEIHFPPLNAIVGQKISISGTVSTYSLAYTTPTAYGGGVLSDSVHNNNTFLDFSPTPSAVARSGNVTQGSFSPFGNNWSNYFDGTGDNLSLATATALGSGNTTVEFWFYPTDGSVTYRCVYDGRSTVGTDTGYGIFQYGRTIEIYGTALIVASAALAFSVNTWVHVAVVRSSNSVQIYINGTASGSSATYSNSLTSTIRRIGDSVNTLFPFVGFVSNLRETTTAVYTANFTVPTAPLTAITNTSLLTCQSNRFIDNGTNTFAIARNGDASVQRFSPFNSTMSYSADTIGGSGYFDGTGDHLVTQQSSTTWNFTGNFCFEAWIYLTAFGSGVSGTYTLFFTTHAVNNYFGVIRIGGNNWFDIWDGSTTIRQSAGNQFQLNAWNHVAYVRNSGTVTGYLNGVAVVSASLASTFGSANAAEQLYIGASPNWYPAQYLVNGYMSNVRVVRGSPVYTANFTPPTAPLTAVTNTQLLLLGTNAGIIDNAMLNAIETVGNVRLSKVQKKFTNRSIFFDETGDYLTVPPSPNMALGTGDFTIECWVRFAVTPVGNGQGVYQLSNGYLNSQVRGPALGAENSTGQWTIYHGTTFTQSTGNVPAINTWYHTAIVRSSGTTKLYVNGVSIISVADTTNYTDQYFTIGGWYSTGFLFNGYIDDLRITRGVARYTANFIPFTSAFPRIKGESQPLQLLPTITVAVSPAVNGRTSYDLSYEKLTLDAGTVYTITNNNSTSITFGVKLWGGGSGGTGGYTYGNYTLSSSTSVRCQVGSAGGIGNSVGQGGGGASAIYSTSTTTTVYAVAGGGGGTGNGGGGNGGGATGVAGIQCSGWSAFGGSGGTQTEGGAGGFGDRGSGTSGSFAQGGNGSGDSTIAAGGSGWGTGGTGRFKNTDGWQGGGGGGYYGGGGGGASACGGGGGGGSGYVGGLTTGTTIQGVGSDSDRGTAGNAATNGKIVLLSSLSV
jgi:hypothetical protein